MAYKKICLSTVSTYRTILLKKNIAIYPVKYEQFITEMFIIIKINA